MLWELELAWGLMVVHKFVTWQLDQSRIEELGERELEISCYLCSLHGQNRRISCQWDPHRLRSEEY